MKVSEASVFNPSNICCVASRMRLKFYADFRKLLCCALSVLCSTFLVAMNLIFDF